MSQSRYSILIICEGDNTEPLFFNSIRDEIQNKTYDIDASIKILPEPKFIKDSYNEEKSSNFSHKKQRRKRALRRAIGDEPKVIKGAPPLKWILAGQKELEDGTYDEVWAVFDHDNHPKRKEAFEKAEEKINGKKVKIAFSSRSFEYYILLHFERVYKVFQKTECKENDISVKCGTNQHTNDCNGNECISGYARIRRYWNESKSNKSIFPLIKERLVYGFENSAWLRFMSDSIEKNTPVYDRNPYVNADYLVKRLTNYDEYQWTWISDTRNINGLDVSITTNYQIEIQNKTTKTIIILSNSFFRVNASD